MSKTTIDGLKVRESAKPKRRVSTTRNVVAHGRRTTGVSSRAAMSGVAERRNVRTAGQRVSTGTARQTYQTGAVAQTDQYQGRRDDLLIESEARSQRAASAESFLEPVRSFGEYDEYAGQDEYTGRDEYDSYGFDDESHGRLALPATTETSWENLLEAWTAKPAEAESARDEDARKSGRGGDAQRGMRGEDAMNEKPHEMLDEREILEKFADEEEDEDEDRQGRKAQKRRKKFSVGKAIALAMVAILVVGGGVLYMWGDGLISRLTGGKSGLFDSLWAMVSDEVPFETDGNGRTNVLIFGTEGYDMNGTSGNGVHDGAQLTDSIMVASFDQKTKDVALLSLPRDLKVSMACSAGKINEVFWCHNQNGTNEEAGAQALMKQIGEVLGIEFQYYAHVNWGSLVDIIDTLGGVTVTLDENINDYYYTGAVAKAGEPITVNGEQALGLARARHGTTGGDFTRGNTQQKIVEAIVQKVQQNGVGMNEALSLLNILGDNLRSNFSADNIKAAVRLASGFNVANIRQVPLVNYEKSVFYVTTTTINEVSYVVPAAGERNYAAIQEYVAEMFSSDAVKREQAKLAVYNATGGYGVASAERGRLEEAGYTVVRVGDATNGVCEEARCVYETSSEKVATRAALEQYYGVAVRPAEELPNGVWAGDVDFVIIVGKVEE